MPDLANIDVIDTVDVFEVAPLLPTSLGNIDMLVTSVEYVALPSAPPAAAADGSTTARADGATLGVDFASFPTLSSTFGLVGGRRAVSEMLYRRLTTPRGTLYFHPDFGRDVRAYLNEGMTPARIAAIRSDVLQEAKRDERIIDAECTVSFNAGNESLSIDLQVATADGPFQLTLRVTSVDVELLFEER